MPVIIRVSNSAIVKVVAVVLAVGVGCRVNIVPFNDVSTILSFPKTTIFGPRLIAVYPITIELLSRN